MPEYQEIYLPDSKLTGLFMKKGSGDPIVYLHGVFGAEYGLLSLKICRNHILFMLLYNQDLKT